MEEVINLEKKLADARSRIVVNYQRFREKFIKEARERSQEKKAFYEKLNSPGGCYYNLVDHAIANNKLYITVDNDGKVNENEIFIENDFLVSVDISCENVKRAKEQIQTLLGWNGCDWKEEIDNKIYFNKE